MDDRDAWLEDVRRWFYGGTPPAEPQPPAPQTAPRPAGAKPPPTGPHPN